MPSEIRKPERSFHALLFVLGPYLWGLGLMVHGLLRMRGIDLRPAGLDPYVLATLAQAVVLWYVIVAADLLREPDGWRHAAGSLLLSVMALPVIVGLGALAAVAAVWTPAPLEAAAGLAVTLLSLRSFDRHRQRSFSEGLGRLPLTRP